MLLEKSEKILIAHRRLYESDEPRFFIGEVEAYDSGLAKVRGHSWHWPSMADVPLRKEEIRTKLFSLGSGTLFAYLLPSWIDLSSVQFQREGCGMLTLKGDSDFGL